MLADRTLAIDCSKPPAGAENWAIHIRSAEATELLAWVQLCGALEEAERLAAEGVNVAREHGVPLYRVQGESVQACVRLQRGELQKGLSGLIAGVLQFRGMGARYMLPLYLPLPRTPTDGWVVSKRG